MRKVVVYEFVSLDGVAEQPDQFVTDIDSVMDEYANGLIPSQDTVLLGRRTYDEWAEFWPTSDIEPYASFINSVQKFVATSTPLQPEWARTSVITTDLARFVTELKAQPGGDIGLHGSISLAQSLFNAGLVDGVRLVVHRSCRCRGADSSIAVLPGVVRQVPTSVEGSCAWPGRTRSRSSQLASPTPRTRAAAT